MRAGAAAARQPRRRPDRHLFRRLGACPQASELADEAAMASARSAPRSTATSSAWRCAPSAAPGSAAPRRRWWRCGSTAGSSRWSAAAIIAAASFNRATQARRQPGSAFKLFVYLAAFRAGYTPDTPVDDAPIRLGDWQPRNYGDSYRGRDPAARGGRPVEQFGGGADVRAGRPRQCHPRRPRPRHHHAAAPRPEPAARAATASA